MTVYADVLVIINFMVDYFLISAAGLILKKQIKLWRHILAALAGGISCIYIFFAPDSIFLELLLLAGIYAVVSVVAFGMGGWLKFFKSYLILLAVTVSFGGIMNVLCNVFKVRSFLVHNSVVYFNISPMFLCLATVIGYLVFIVFSKIFGARFTSAQSCKVTLFYNGNRTTFDALIDTGNSVKDVFGKREIIIADSSIKYAVFGEKNKDNDENLKRRYNPIPCSTVGEVSLLEGYRCDSAKIEKGDKTFNFKSPVLAISKTKIDNDFSGIVNPEIFN